MRILYGFLCLFFLIFFHETGHFLFAVLFKVKVEAFSIGFGPVLLHRKWRGTDYRLSLIPLGGYCAMKGEKDFAKALEQNLSEIQAESDSLYGVHPAKRALIAFAGPFFNLIFAMLAFTVIAAVGYEYQTYSNTILIPNEAEYPDLHSAAREAGLISGDTILKINKTEITDFSEIIREISVRPDEDVTLLVQRADLNEPFLVTIHTDLDKERGSGKIGVMANSDFLHTVNVEGKILPFAIAEGAKQTADAVILTLKGFSILFKGVNMQNAVSGPVRVADMMGSVLKSGFSDSVRAGIVNMCSIMAVISVSLAVMNLLPLPVLDGGLILFALIECIFRRKLSPKVLYYIQFFGAAVIIALFLLGLTGDILYFMRG